MPFMDMEIKMTKRPNTLIIDAITGEQIVRELTDDEFAQHQLDRAYAQTKLDEAEAKAAAKVAAQGKLAALGLTVEDLQALGL